MPYDFNIYHSQVTPSIPDYDTVTVITSSDLDNYATKPYVKDFGDSNYLSLQGGTLEGDLILNNQGGIAKNLILKSSTGIPISIRAGITFVNNLTSETGIVLPGLLITDGRLDITPDPVFNRAEFRIQGANSQFNIFNINTFEFYMRVNSDTSVMFGRNTVALSAGAIAMGVSTSAINIGAHAEGSNTLASGTSSHAEGSSTVAIESNSHAEGQATVASGGSSHAEGSSTFAYGGNSHAEGSGTTATGLASHAEGNSSFTGRAVDFANYDPLTKLFTFSPANSAFFDDGVSVGSILRGTSFTGPVNIFFARVLSRNSITGAISADTTPFIPFSTNSGRLIAPAGNYAHAEGTFTSAIGANSHTEGQNTVASGSQSHAEGSSTVASGANSHAEGLRTVARGDNSHAAGRDAVAVGADTWIWRGTGTGNLLPSLSTTRIGQFAVHATTGGITLNNRVGIGTDSIANALTVVGNVSATGTVFSSGAPVVVSTSTFETPTTGISAISNIVSLSQATYDALTVKLPTTLYIIV
jgi:hypothetical protein